ncbi:MAG: ABC transporter ATP-binding protein [Desulfovibrio sp.]|jgi:branched-chain amino acid transport system ATP-binding protein|nr:ABC transporter ATP-binding protein [Desulfovibrio sp.]
MDNRQSYLELRDLSVGYAQADVLHGISMRVEEGEIIALLGANGAGKTTALTAISGLLRPRAGGIFFAGRSLHATPSHKIVEMGITHAPEGRRVFGSLSVMDNLKLGAFTLKDGKQKKKLLDWVCELFPRLRERGEQLAGTLSGGEQQMLSIGRALMSDPKILLLDEPSLGLAPMLVAAIFKSIREINDRGVTVILVEQNARAALKIADRGYVLEVGKMVLEDKAEVLLANTQVQAAYLGGAKVT